MDGRRNRREKEGDEKRIKWDLTSSLLWFDFYIASAQFLRSN